jgi:hypothetical protein
MMPARIASTPADEQIKEADISAAAALGRNG